MYESHFGLSGTPFSLNPDPGFYFQSKGHGSALSYLRFGVYQGEGFVVVTGEIGAGKTTLVRTLLSELDDRQIVAAQIVSTQLEAGDLLRAVAIAFGLPPKNLSKAELIASIEAFLTLLVTQNKRALLIVDEAQNLNLQAVEELRMLSNFQLGTHALLQSFLVGQPELRGLLLSRPMEQFRQRVIASCHLGPMDCSETREYIEHRLKKVGWQGRPSITPKAFELIFEHTTGIPRRVNLLCNRLLLAAFLAASDEIDEDCVTNVVNDAFAEVGPAKVATTAAVPQAAAGTPHEEPKPNSPRIAARPRGASPSDDRRTGPLMCVTADRSDDIKMAVLLQAIQRRQSAPALILVRVGEPSNFALNDGFYRQLNVDVPTIEIPVAGGTPCGEMADVMRKFEAAIDLHKPRAVVVLGHSDAILACSLVATKKARPLALAEGAVGIRERGAPDEFNRHLIEEIAQLTGAAESAARQVIAGNGDVPSPRVAGGLLSEAAAMAASAAIAPGEVLAMAEANQLGEFEEHGYCVVSLAVEPASKERQHLTELLGFLRKISAEIPLVWPLPAELSAHLDALGLRKKLRGERIALMALPGYAESIALLAGANCVLTNSAEVQIEAAALDVPCLLLDASNVAEDAVEHGINFLKDMRGGVSVLRGGFDMATVPDMSSRHHEGPVANRIAEQIAGWLEPGDLTQAPAGGELVA